MGKAFTSEYNANQEGEFRTICEQLAELISNFLPEAEGKIWHAHPVWFLEGNPIVGYSKQKPGIRLLFWSGKDFELNKLTDDNKLTYWATHDEIKKATINLEWNENQKIDFIRLREYIQLGQRIEKVSVESFESGNWVKVGEATSIGAARIISLNKTVHSRKLRVMIEAPTCITLAELGCYKKHKP
jgi:hypothetical protein